MPIHRDLREHLVEQDVADDGAQGSRGDTLQRSGEEGDLHDALERIDNEAAGASLSSRQQYVMTVRHDARDG
ncbi:MAG TPA: hypothetical protein VN820_04180, partial [Acidimicrobiales bacterium]|nr:hypothetical protein [Acidimicrobiales bacterium]